MQYIKKPVVIEAIKYSSPMLDPLPRWFEEAVQQSIIRYDESLIGGHSEECLIINTLEGTMRANLGDYIIRGVKGEIYSCRADIFHLTYETASIMPDKNAICDGMTFGHALHELKSAKRVARKGWNGKGMYIYLTKGSVVRQARDNVLDDIIKTCGHCVINPRIDMKAADNSIVCGWLASQTDMLAEDWIIVE